MSTGDRMNNPPFKRKKNDSFSDFISNIDQLFSGPKPLGGVLQSMDSFFSNSTMNRSFPIELTEERDAYIVKAKLAGIKQQQIHIEAYNQSLLISIQRYETAGHKDSNGKTFSKKQTLQTISRNVTFVKPIDDQSVTAHHNDGLLEIIVPKLKGKEVKFIR
ncbi:MAG: Hsp20/alpha crystallin family protein [Bacillus sp. (in: firmicutes)]